ncbi:DUF3618 domain-containing protein, partial [Streptomyces capparidis]
MTTRTDTARGGGLEELRDDIERTRHDLGQTVEELAAKADVKSRVQHRAAELTSHAKERVARATHLARHNGSGAPKAKERLAAAAETLEEKAPQQVTDTVTAAARSGKGRGAAVAIAAGAAAAAAWPAIRRARGSRGTAPRGKA